MTTLRSGVILYHHEDLRSVAELLFHLLREKITWDCYDLPSQLDLYTHFDFLLIGHERAIAETIYLYQRNQMRIPPIIHVTPPYKFINYAEYFPEAVILGIVQAELDDLDVTLQFDEFVWAIEMLVGQSLS